MFYSIRESLTPCSPEEALHLPEGVPFVAVLTVQEWKEMQGRLGIETDIELDVEAPRET